MPIQTVPNRAANQWVLTTDHVAYSLGLNTAGLLAHCYWGPRLPYLEDYPAPLDPTEWPFNSLSHLVPEEYPGYGGTKFIDPCLKVTFPDGVRDLVLKFESAHVSENELQITL